MLTARTTVRLLVAAAMMLPLLVGFGCSQEGTLTVELTRKSDSGQPTLSDVAAILVTEKAFAAFKAGELEELYTKALNEQRLAQESYKRYQAAMKPLSDTNFLNAEQKAVFDQAKAINRETAAANARYDAIKLDFFDRMTAGALHMTPDGPSTFSARIPKHEKFVLVIWGTPVGGPGPQRHYWVGWASLYGERKRLITADADKKSWMFPFRDPPITW